MNAANSQMLGCWVPGHHCIDNAIAKGRRMTRSEISGAVRFSKDKTIRILNTLVARGLVERLGEGPGTRYRRA